ncbi:MAG: uracil-DNA glycosylase [Acidobacteriota bacterium]
MKDAPGDEIRTLLEDIADQLRFLSESGVSFISAVEAALSLPATSAPVSASHLPASVSDVRAPESCDVVDVASTALPTLNSLSLGQPGGELKLFVESASHYQSTAPSFLNADKETLSRTPVDCNQTAYDAPKLRQDSLFRAVLPPETVAPDATLDAIRADLGDCQRCKLATCRTNIVFGEGAPQASLVFVGEGPGADEDATGRPFVGRAGQLLDKIIAAMGLRREDVYICNVVKCRPPENRTPEPDEVAACVGFLHRQLAVIRPRVIVALGASAASALLGDPKLGGISKIRGRFQDYRGIPLMPTFHPAYLLRAPDKKREVWEDIKQVMALLRERQTQGR